MSLVTLSLLPAVSDVFNWPLPSFSFFLSNSCLLTFKAWCKIKRTLKVVPADYEGFFFLMQFQSEWWYTILRTHACTYILVEKRVVQLHRDCDWTNWSKKLLAMRHICSFIDTCIYVCLNIMMKDTSAHQEETCIETKAFTFVASLLQVFLFVLLHLITEDFPTLRHS